MLLGPALALYSPTCNYHRAGIVDAYITVAMTITSHPLLKQLDFYLMTITSPPHK